MRSNIFYLVTLALLFSLPVYSNVYTVTNAAGNAWFPACGDPGSFLEALCSAAANPGRDTIRFNLPGGTSITSLKDPITIDGSGSDLLIDGLSTQDGNPIIFNFSVAVTGTDVEFYGTKFQTTNHSLTLTGNNNTVDSCFFAVTGAGQNAVWINGGTGSTVKRSFFTATKLHAISIENGGSHTIDSCIVTNSVDVGIIVRGTGGNTIKNCSVSLATHNGIGLISGSNIIENCLSFDNDRAGIVCDNTSGFCSNNIIRYNEIHNNNKVFWMNLGSPLAEQAGIQSDGASTTIYNNWVYNNAGNGILINTAFGTNGIIRNNIVGRDKLGNESGNGWNGIFVWSGNNSIIDSNIVVNNGKGSSHATYGNSMPDRISGIRVQGVTSGTVKDNYIGTDALKTNAGNDFDGITLHTNVFGVTVHNNVVCNNGLASAYGNGGGVALRINTNNITITSNFIGVHRDLTDGGNNDYGISVEGGGNVMIGGTNLADGNTIGFSKNTPVLGSARGCGVWMILSGASNNSMFNNAVINNTGAGVELDADATNNIIGDQNKGNVITGNQYGILVHNASAVQNTLRYNSFSCNTVQGISLQDDGNTEYGNTPAPKGIVVRTDESRANFVSGYAPSASAVVDVYVVDNNCTVACDSSASQGMTMVATVSAAGVASANGLYFWEYDFVSGGNLVGKNDVIVLATEVGLAGQTNTSEFSICHFECSAPENAAISSADLSLCAGETAVLTANSTGKVGTETYSYSWYDGAIDPSNLVFYALDDSVYNTSTAGTYIAVISSLSDTTTCLDTSSTAMVVVNNAPGINLNPATTYICTASSLTLDPNATGSNLQYMWKPGGEVSSTLDVTASGTYEVVVTNSVTGCKDSSDVSIDEYNTPNVVGISSPDLDVCMNEMAELTANITGQLGTDDYTFNWYLNTISGGSEVHTAVNDSSFSTNVAGDYFVVVTNNTGSNVCADSSAQATVTLNDYPVINLTVPSADLCSGESVELDADATGSNLQYVWKPNSETTDKITTSVGGTFEVVVSNSTTGCKDSSSVVITAINTPDVIDISSLDFDVCSDENAVLTANVIGQAGGDTYTYDWYLNSITGGNKVHSVSNDSTYSTNVAGNYFVVVSNNAGGNVCADSSTSAAVTVNDYPVINLTTTSTSFCAGDSIELDADATGSNLEYLWKPNGEIVSKIITKEGGTFEVVVSDVVAGCSDSADVDITVNSLPVGNATAPFFCQGDSTLVAAGVSGMTYSWSPSASTDESFYVTSSGTHIVTITDPTTLCTSKDTVEAEQSPVAKPVVVLPLDSMMCAAEGDQIEITATVTTNTTGILSWSDGTVDEMSIIAFDTLNYIATFEDQYGCTGDDTMKIHSLCIPPDPTLPNVISIESPWTPFGEITPEKVQKSDFTVYNRWGLIMFQTDENLPTWNGINDLGMRCSPGVYFWIWKYTDNTGEELIYNGFAQLLE